MTAWARVGRTAASPSRLVRAAPPCRPDAGVVRPTGHHAAGGSEVCQDGARADQDRRRRLPPRPSPRARAARRGRGPRGPHHRLEKQSASDAKRRCRRKASYDRRSQFCSEVAEGRPPSAYLPASTLVLWRFSSIGKLRLTVRLCSRLYLEIHPNLRYFHG
jgi:hypothetical protein